MEALEEELKAQMDSLASRMCVNQAKTETNQKRTEEYQEELSVEIKTYQKEIQTAINSVQSELEGTIQNWMENVLASVNRRTQDSAWN
jgi:uncharacterized protein YydD (DUF2326 family)